MSWFKVDDKLWGHPKWLATPPRARSLWVTAGSWSASQETDGVIPTHVLHTLGGRAGDAADLVKSGLWRTCREGWRFHDWSKFQPDAASQRAKREAESAGGAFGNHKRWHVRQGVNVPDCPFCSGEDSGTRSGADQGGESPPSPPDPYPNPIPDGEPQASIVQFRTGRASGDGLTLGGDH